MDMSHKQPRRIPGRVRGRAFEKRVKVANRFRQHGNGYAIAEYQLLSAQAQGIPEVRLFECETGKTLRAPLSVVLGGKLVGPPRYERQRVLPLACWTIEDPDQPTRFRGEA